MYAKEAFTLGDLRYELDSPKQRWLVPIVLGDSQSPQSLGNEERFLTAVLSSQEGLEHLYWMLQKDALKQDIALLGPPGPLRRRLALRFCEVTQREFEYVALSRDTCEADLKQRREILNKTAFYVDQAAVRAAIEGRVLIIEGLEKAERNILPILNNLLENREMALEDGRFLTHPERFDQLLGEGYTPADLARLGLVRVHPDFRVIALALPAPKYQGHPLDPPLRSRFQARFVSSDLGGASSHLSLLQPLLLPSALPRYAKFVAFAHALKGMDAVAKDSYKELRPEMAEMPQRSFDSLLRLLSSFPTFSLSQALSFLYPWRFLNLKKAAASAAVAETVSNSLKKFELLNDGEEFHDFEIKGQEIIFHSRTGTRVSFQLTAEPVPHNPQHKILLTPHHRSLLASMLISHFTGSDLCLLGPKGSGKSEIVREFARIVGLEIETQLLYRDMNHRDLLQRRFTSPNGDTTWRHSNLVDAALYGRLAVLDNFDRLNKDALASIQSLLVDRFLILPDGTRLIDSSRYSILLRSSSSAELQAQKIFPIHPRFRVVALGESPSPSHDYLTLEVAGCFNVHSMPQFEREEEEAFLAQIVPLAPKKWIHAVLNFSHTLSSDPEFKTSPFSLRQSIRVLQSAVDQKPRYPKQGNLHNLIQEAVLAKFLPASNRSILSSILKNAEIFPESEPSFKNAPETPLVSKEAHPDAHLVPKILFVENERHARILAEMGRAFARGENLLLIGNQGTGKNKLTDRFLEQSRLPRQYIQLHRDTTVESLTTQPTIKDGVVHYEDSPLITAVRNGHVLVIDELDKAEVEVVTILKNLIDGEMNLADHRRILASHRITAKESSSDKELIPIHPAFRIIALANRPGWPFLGNKFFKECGDMFSVHVVDNPDLNSELQLLRSYAPQIDEDTLKRLGASFDRLRRLHDEGLLTYPYSTREVVNVVRHLARFPNEPLPSILQNVFSFDALNTQAQQHIREAFKEHGIDVGTDFTTPAWRPKLAFEHMRDSVGAVSGPKFGKIDPENKPHVGGNTWAGGTGGRDTAGLGGKGGPFRMASGHEVHQLPDYLKNDIDSEILKKAREMAVEGLQKRLQEIHMSPYDAEAYEKYYRNVRHSIEQMRVILEGLEAENNDARFWSRNQTTGDLDENKMVEGITGEKSIYKRRVPPEKNRPNFHPQNKPKRIRFVMDVSASMYRFDGSDRRLRKMLETAVMIMESFEGFESKILYSIVGHSGNSDEISLIREGNSPKNRRERLAILESMIAHSQFCWPGDQTLDATQKAIDTIAAEEADAHFVFVLSDANFDRYGIDPASLGRILTSDEKVKAFAIFIASLWEGQAERLASSMPAGRGFVCLNPAELPAVFQKLLTANVLGD